MPAKGRKQAIFYKQILNMSSTYFATLSESCEHCYAPKTL